MLGINLFDYHIL